MSYIFSALKPDNAPNMDNVNIGDALRKCIDNLNIQFKAGDDSYKNKKKVNVVNYEKFYDELLAYDNHANHIYQDNDNVVLTNSDFLINEIHDISGLKEQIEHINVVYDNNQQEFIYSNTNINHNIGADPVRETKTGQDYRYKKYELIAEDFPKKCVFGNLYSRTIKHNNPANAGESNENKSYEYLDLTGYLLYDYVHNFEKYQNNNICDKLNKILEDRILDILDFENKYIKYVKEKGNLEFPTFTLYDVIYPNAHYIYKVENKNFCLPVDRVICHYKNQADQIQNVPNYFDGKLTLTNFIQDIFGMDIKDIKKPIQDLFIKCLHKKLLKLFTFDEQENESIFYGVDLTYIHSDLLALFAFFNVLNEKIIKNDYDILDIEIFKSFNLSTSLYFDSQNLDKIDCNNLPFLYKNDIMEQIDMFAYKDVINGIAAAAANAADAAGAGVAGAGAGAGAGAAANAAAGIAAAVGAAGAAATAAAVAVGAAAVYLKSLILNADNANTIRNNRLDQGNINNARDVASNAINTNIGVGHINVPGNDGVNPNNIIEDRVRIGTAAANICRLYIRHELENHGNYMGADITITNIVTQSIPYIAIYIYGNFTLLNLGFIDAGNNTIVNNPNIQNIKFLLTSGMYKNNYVFDNNLQNQNQLFNDLLLNNISRMGIYGLQKINTQQFKFYKQFSYGCTDIEDISVIPMDDASNGNQDLQSVSIIGINIGTRFLKNRKYCISGNLNLHDKINDVRDLSKKSFSLGIIGFLIFQTSLLNTKLTLDSINLIQRLYFIILKHTFAQHYIYDKLIKSTDIKNRISDMLSDATLSKLFDNYNRNFNIDIILFKIFKSLMIDDDSYKNILNIVNGETVVNANNIIKMNYPFFYKHNGQYDSENIFYDVLRDFNKNYYKHSKENKKINFINNFNIKRHKIYGDNEIFQLINNMITKKITLHKEENLINKKPEQQNALELSDNDTKAISNFINSSGAKLGKNTIDILTRKNIQIDERINLKNKDIEKRFIDDFKKLQNYGIMKGGEDYEVDILYDCEKDIYSLLVLIYYNKLTIQKLKYYHYFILLLKSEYFKIFIQAGVNCLRVDGNGAYLDTMNRKYKFDNDFNLFTEKLNNKILNNEDFNNFKDNLLIFNKLIYYYLFGFNCYFIKGNAQKTILDKFYVNNFAFDNQGKKLASIAMLFNSLDENTNNLSVDYIRMMVKANKTVFQNIDYVEKRTDNINIPKQNIGNMNLVNNNGYYQMSQIPQSALSSLTDGKSIAPTFLNNSGLLPYLLSRNLHTDIIKGGGENNNVFDQTVDAIASIKHTNKEYIRQAFKNNNQNNVLNSQQMAFLNLSNQVYKWINQETDGILELIKYARNAMAAKNLKGDKLQQFKEFEKQIQEKGINFDILRQMNELNNDDAMIGGQDIQNILSKLKQTEYNIQQKKNEYIEKLNDYLKSF